MRQEASVTPERHKPRVRLRATPSEVLCMGFAAMILFGTLLFMTPAAAQHEPLNFVDALFTATSAVCVTGLSVFDPGSTLTQFGQLVLMILIQLGGLGFMTFTTVISRMTRHRSSLHSRVLLRESISASQMHGLGTTAARILMITFTCEVTGAILLMTRFIPRFGLGRGIYLSIFHAISSFCNAGFDVFGGNNNLIGYAGDALINGVTMALVTIGGLGFFVVMEVFEKMQGKRPHRKMSLGTRMVLVISTVLVVGGAAIFMLAEWHNPKTLGNPTIPDSQRVMEGFFQSVTTRTAGFMTINQGDMRPISKIMTVILMFIGASPAGTGGGLKTTTFAILTTLVWTVLQGRKELVIMKRRIPLDLVQRAAAVFSLAVIAIVVVVGTIMVLEPAQDIGSIVFETVSAFGTAGLSTGITGMLSAPSLILLVITMFGGRLGLFTVSMAIAYRLANHESHISYPEERILIG